MVITLPSGFTTKVRYGPGLLVLLKLWSSDSITISFKRRDEDDEGPPLLKGCRLFTDCAEVLRVASGPVSN
jgi:hypothetical protein